MGCAYLFEARVILQSWRFEYTCFDVVSTPAKAALSRLL